MKITFVSADDTITFAFDIDSRSAMTDLTKIEKELSKDLTDIIQKVLDVSFKVTSPAFTRGPKDAYVVSYSWTLYPVYEGRVVENNAVKSVSVNVGDSDRNMYEFENVEDRDVDAMITWLRKEHQVYYSPNDELRNEKKKVEDLKKQLAAKDTNIRDLNNINAALGNDKKDLSKFRSDIMGVLFGGVPCASFDENSKNIIDALKALREFRKEIIKRAGVNESETSDDYILKSLDIKLDNRAGNRFIDKVYELAGCGRYSYTLDDVIEHLEAGLDDARGLSLKIEELEEKLRNAKETIERLSKDNNELVLDNRCYMDLCDEKEREIQEWEDRFDRICEELDTDPEEDFDEVIDELKKDLKELDDLSEFKARLSEVIKLPEGMKRTATTEDYISCFEHTKKEWRRMEIKLENYETENRLLLERNHELSASNGAMDVLRNLYTHVKGQEPPLESNPSAIAAVCKYEFDTLQTMKRDYTNAKCARAELANLYKRILGEERLDPKLEDIKNICDGDSDILNIIGE